MVTATLLTATVLLGQVATPALLERRQAASLFVDVPVKRNVLRIQLADVIHVTIQVAGSQGLVVTAPAEITRSAGWRALAVATPPPDKREESVAWQRTYTLEPLRPGESILQIEPLSYREDDDNKREISWAPLVVHVLVPATTGDLKEMRDRAEIEVIEVPSEEDGGWWLGLAVALPLVIAAAAVCYRLWRRRARPKSASADQRALRELDRIGAWRLPDRGKTGQYHTLVANVLRRYLENRFQLPARRRATTELLVTVRACGQLSSASQEFLCDFFTRCDLAKFARAEVPPGACLELAEKARAFIGQSAPLK